MTTDDQLRTKIAIGTQLKALLSTQGDGIVVDIRHGKYIVKWNDLGEKSHSLYHIGQVITVGQYNVIPPPNNLPEELFII